MYLLVHTKDHNERTRKPIASLMSNLNRKAVKIRAATGTLVRETIATGAKIKRPDNEKEENLCRQTKLSQTAGLSHCTPGGGLVGPRLS